MLSGERTRDNPAGSGRAPSRLWVFLTNGVSAMARLPTVGWKDLITGIPSAVLPKGAIPVEGSAVEAGAAEFAGGAGTAAVRLAGGPFTRVLGAAGGTAFADESGAALGLAEAEAAGDLGADDADIVPNSTKK